MARAALRAVRVRSAMTSAAEFAALLGAKRVGNVYIGDCPVCGYPGALSIRQGYTAPLVTCHVGCSRSDIVRSIPGRVIRRMPDAADRQTASSDADVRLLGTGAARDLWRQSRPLAGSVAQSYLAKRGITHPLPPTLRFLHARHTPSQNVLPCMIGAATLAADHSVIAVHRTFLKSDGSGKSVVPPARMTLGPVGGAAVHLAPIGEVLGIAEGIETALSAMQLSGIPTWAALSAGGIEKLRLPALPLACEIVIFADHDRRGIEAAWRAKAQWEKDGRRVRIELPPKPGTDFNDVLRGVA